VQANLGSSCNAGAPDITVQRLHAILCKGYTLHDFGITSEVMRRIALSCALKSPMTVFMYNVSGVQLLVVYDDHDYCTFAIVDDRSVDGYGTTVGGRRLFAVTEASFMDSVRRTPHRRYDRRMT